VASGAEVFVAGGAGLAPIGARTTIEVFALTRIGEGRR